MKIYIDGDLPKSCASCLFLMHCDECEGHENYCTLIGHVGYDPSDNLIDGAPVTPSSERHDECPLEHRPRGAWIEKTGMRPPEDKYIKFCSSCMNRQPRDFITHKPIEPDFCPWCGSDNRKRGEAE